MTLSQTCTDCKCLMPAESKARCQDGKGYGRDAQMRMCSAWKGDTPPCGTRVRGTIAFSSVCPQTCGECSTGVTVPVNLKFTPSHADPMLTPMLTAC